MMQPEQEPTEMKTSEHLQEIEENGADEQLSADEEQEEKRRKRLLAALLLLLLMLCCSTTVFYRYLRRPAPLPELLLPQAAVDYPPHYLYSIYGVDKPVGVALSPEEDRIYVSESGGERLVRVFDRSGNSINSIAPPRTRPSERSPVYLATDSTGRLFVTDRMQHSIYVFGRNGSYLDTLLAPDLSLSEYIDKHIGGLLLGTTYAYNAFQGDVYYKASGADELTLPAPIVGTQWSPLGIHINDDNEVLITDVTEDHNSVHKYSLPSEPILVTWHRDNLNTAVYGTSGQGNGEFLFPNDAAIDSQGRIYVSDGNNGRISVWSDQGEFLFNFGNGNGDGALSLPRGIFIDQRDRLFVIDAVGQNVKVYNISNPEPIFLYDFGDWGMDDGLFNYPNDIVVDQSGRLYIVDRENNRVQVWSY